MAKRPPKTKSDASAGPVTMAQATAEARAQLPKPKKAKAAVAAAAPATVAAERRRLALKRKQDLLRRIQEYTLTLKIMKKRGVKGLKAKTTTGPLQILAEGDSWFDYPVPLFGGGIITRLERQVGVPILNLAKAGDEVRYMLGVAERKRLIQLLSKGCPAGGPWDVLLFSGGGNDIVDNPMALWIKDFDPALPPARHIHQPRFDAALALVRAGYEDLIALRDRLSAGTQLVLHAYDFAIPDGRGYCLLGPWLKPTFDLRKFPDPASRFAVVKVMLQQFAGMLRSLQAAHPKVTFIDAQGTLAPQASSWHNELHPAKSGFTTFAGIFHQKLKALFPNRVL